jgi:anti-sigma-K factor RskA
MPDTHILDDLGAYALGALDPDDRKAADRHLANCPACRQAAAEFRKLANELHAGVHLETPPGGTWDAIAARLPRERRPTLLAVTAAPLRDRRFRMFVVGWAATAAALVALIASVAWDTTREPANPTIAELASKGDTSVVPLAGAISGASGRFYVSDEHKTGGLAVTGLPSSANGKTYQVWFIGTDQHWTWGGSVHVNASGDGVTKLNLPATLADFAGVAVCTEPPADSTVQWGEMVLSGPVYE